MSYGQPPPMPPQPQWGAPPPKPPAGPRPGWARKRIIIPAAVVLFFVGVIIGSAGGDSGSAETSAGATPAATETVTAQPVDDAKPAPTVTVTKTATAKAKPEATAEEAPDGKAVFKVWGTASSGVDITYGSDGTNLQGSKLPMEKTLAVDADAFYYQVTAQLQGGGDIQCSVTIDGKTKTGRAQGGYNICSAQLNSDFSGGFS